MPGLPSCPRSPIVMPPLASSNTVSPAGVASAVAIISANVNSTGTPLEGPNWPGGVTSAVSLTITSGDALERVDALKLLKPTPGEHSMPTLPVAVILELVALASSVPLSSSVNEEPETANSSTALLTGAVEDDVPNCVVTPLTTL